MQDFFTANHYELNKDIESFLTELSKYLQNKFYSYQFQISNYNKSQERPLILNNLGLKFLSIQPLTFKNDKWIKDKDWRWSNEKIDMVTEICACVALRYDFKFIGINTSMEQSPLFLIRVAQDISN